jgi:uncharacterized protein
MFSIVPTYSYKNVMKINPINFKEKELLIFDIDNTLFYPESTKIDPKVEKWFKKASKCNKCICLSNSNTIKQREKEIKKILGCDIFISSRKKPSKKLFKEVQQKYKVKASKMVMIGDMHLTDVLFGNRGGATTIHVKPFAKEKLSRIVIGRMFEKLLLLLLLIPSISIYNNKHHYNNNDQ